ncbi:hypothetical protein CDV31_001857 [Fusarium ambrosium]|uniref:Uncharacterized protein n=1 Tax=Fusarium ambrosium TaxID=131363 RepID=A0A428UXZ4_9HYPO|nr:hypothetical protein CDV31_001857 [Fusarium ambrosium]
MATYKITIKNKSGQTQNYCFFNERPTVSGAAVTGELWSNIMKTAEYTPDQGVATFKVSGEYFAICGKIDTSSGPNGTVTVSKTVPIQVGESLGGKVTLGSTVPLIVHKRKACDIGHVKTPGGGKIGNFQFDTTCKDDNIFTAADAKANNLLIGVASSKDGDIGTAMATFHPAPNVTYQVQPKPVYYVAFGSSFEVGDLVKVEAVGSSLAVDFVARSVNEVTIIHDDTNTLYFQ